MGEVKNEAVLPGTNRELEKKCWQHVEKHNKTKIKTKVLFIFIFLKVH